MDPSQLQNAILNLAINARDAMPSGGRLTITAENTELEADYARLHPEVRAGRYVVIAVTDTGTGMAKEVLERAFEPFFTTKEVGTGSGLGLSMVYGFVKQSGGHVTLYSEPDHGTTIRMYLPRAEVPEETAEARAPEPPMDALRGQGETVLLVEDEPRVRRMTAARLQDLGYRVLDAANGPAALALLDQHPEVDLLFTDMVMPGGMTGADLAGGSAGDRARDEGAVHLGLRRAGCGAARAGGRGWLAQEAVQHTGAGAGPAEWTAPDEATGPADRATASGLSAFPPALRHSSGDLSCQCSMHSPSTRRGHGVPASHAGAAGRQRKSAEPGRYAALCWSGRLLKRPLRPYRYWSETCDPNAWNGTLNARRPSSPLTATKLFIGS